MLNGIINVDKNLIFNDEVIIQPGTKFLIKPGKHIVFKKKVDAQGTTTEPIFFQKFDKINSLPWGSVAILGKKTMGSLISIIAVIALNPIITTIAIIAIFPIIAFVPFSP